jgi:hypothetical protein
MNKYFILLLFITIINKVLCQVNDSVPLRSAHKASIMSAIIPGLGQVYNKQYWKLPLIYGGTASLAYSIQSNHNSYIVYKNAYNAEIDNDPNTINQFSQYDQSALALFRDAYRRNLDLSVIGLTLVYILNIIDANVSAHLYYFRVNKNLDISWSPSLHPNHLASLKLEF